MAGSSPEFTSERAAESVMLSVSLIHAFNHAIFFGIFGVNKAITFELFVQMKAY